MQCGDWVVGKWTGEPFQVERPLGTGANGEVYLVRTRRGLAAVKVCSNASDIALEWAVLERLHRVSGTFPKPMWIDDHGPSAFFYVMEWIRGTPLSQAAARLTGDAAAAVVRGIAEGLAELHAAGYAFCDLKPDNIVIAGDPPHVRFVDAGGVTPFGRSVRQFTPYYDRAFWGLGTRRAEPSYDVTALALVVVICLGGLTPPASLAGQTPAQRQAWLRRGIRRWPEGVRHLLEQALAGGMDERQFAAAWCRQAAALPVRPGPRVSPAPLHQSASRRRPAVAGASASMNAAGPGPVAKRKGGRDWTEWLMWISLIGALTSTAWAWLTFLGWVP
ncbi:protein kinase domain-containing protein [Alicyclobacillus macrosporangiidus]|uniref:protein kinase domain-containing protein n=1 Tax=Alicyclobacillus macrosporangiidus TaxID=392015 RepID=UPI00068B48C0|nr:phosphotransferase [Alicyclobacillus macrosporangiidus]